MTRRNDDWLGDEAYVVEALDAPGYMDVPEELIPELTERELIAGVHLGYMRRPQPADIRVKLTSDDYKEFLRKLLQHLHP
jgi:hypothetical protein